MMASPFAFEALNEGQEISELLPHLKSVAGEIAIVPLDADRGLQPRPRADVLPQRAQPHRPPEPRLLGHLRARLRVQRPPRLRRHGVGRGRRAGASLWSNGFLPSVYQGVEFRSDGDPVLFLSDPEGVDRKRRRRILDGINQLNSLELENTGDPEIRTRMAQYELAFKMQMSVPELTDLSTEPDELRAMYGKGNFASHCLQARRLVERGVRFVELYNSSWDHHSGIEKNLKKKCRRPTSRSPR